MQVLGATEAMHLRPRSARSQRRWLLGMDARPPARTLSFSPPEHEHAAFTVLRSLLRFLPCDPADRDEVQALERRLDGLVSVGYEDDERGDGITFALMRRISRESAHSAPIIDAAAKLLNRLVCKNLGRAAMLLERPEDYDRPSLKVLTRSLLLSDTESWVWHFRCDPFEPRRDESMYCASRRRFFASLAQVCDPEVDGSGAALPALVATAAERQVSDAARELVLQNYDAVFLAPIRGEGEEASERHRLFALAAVNAGFIDVAREALRRAQSLATRAHRRAHLCYLQGLLETKRAYDLGEARAFFRRGIDLIDATAERDGDPALERAWLLNGLALVSTIGARLHATDPVAEAFRFVHEAFRLVRDGDSPARRYLRYNLLANTALLFEMRGDYATSIRVLREAFLDADELSATNGAIAYRVGMLMRKARDGEGALRQLRRAVDANQPATDWPAHERVLRAFATVAREAGRHDEANEANERGLELALSNRSRSGTTAHGRALASALLAAGETARAVALNERLAADGVAVLRGDSHTPHAEEPEPASPKIPAYVAEIDLEDIPATDLNRFLTGIASGPAVGFRS